MKRGEPSLTVVCMYSVVSNSCNPMDCNPPGSSVCGIFQATILEWVAISYSGRSSWPRNWTQVSCVSCIGRRILYHCAIWEAPMQCWWEYKLGAQHRDSLKIKKRTIIWSTNYNSVHFSKKKKRLIQKDMCTPMFFASLFTVIKITEATQVPIDRWMDKENVVYES